MATVVLLTSFQKEGLPSMSQVFLSTRMLSQLGKEERNAVGKNQAG